MKTNAAADSQIVLVFMVGLLSMISRGVDNTGQYQYCQSAAENRHKHLEQAVPRNARRNAGISLCGLDFWFAAAIVRSAYVE